MGLFESMNNPWAPGGQMASGNPWAQPGKELGWDNGASELDPPTQQRQAEEENMQLAIAAAAAVAPEMIAEEQRNGGGGGQQVEYQTDGGGQQLSPDVDTTLSGGSEPESSTSSAPTQQQAIWSGNQSVAPSIPSTQAILGPLLQPNAVPMLQQAVRSGQARLNAELHRFYGTQRQASAAAMGMREQFYTASVLAGLAEEIGKNASLKAELITTDISQLQVRRPHLFNRLKDIADKQIGEAVPPRPAPSRLRFSVPSSTNDFKSPSFHHSRMVQIFITQDEENKLCFFQILEEMSEWHDEFGNSHANRTLYITRNELRNKRESAPSYFDRVYRIDFNENNVASQDGLKPIDIEVLSRRRDMTDRFELLDLWTDYVYEHHRNRANGDKETWLEWYRKQVNWGIKVSAFAGLIPFGILLVEGNSALASYLNSLVYAGLPAGRIVLSILQFWGYKTTLAGIGSLDLDFLQSLIAPKKDYLIADTGMSRDGQIWDPPRTPYNHEYDAMSTQTYRLFRPLLLDNVER